MQALGWRLRPKKDPADFVLWKPAAEDEPGWASPWGRGRPGWHIECSAMSATHLGQTFDIHGGGQDLIFPHHENEIAQSRCAHGTSHMARIWMHNGYVVVGGQKMSKSLGNFLTVRELLQEGFPGEAIRLSLLSGHYRQPLDITREKLGEARAQLDSLYGGLREVPIQEGEASEEVLAALCDDLNTPLAIARLHGARRLHKAQGKRVEIAVALRRQRLLGLLQTIPLSGSKVRKARKRRKSKPPLLPARLRARRGTSQRRIAFEMTRCTRYFARTDLRAQPGAAPDKRAQALQRSMSGKLSG